MSSRFGARMAGNRRRSAAMICGRLVDREGRLRDVRDPLGVGELHPLRVLDGLNEDDRVRRLARRPDDLLVALVADQGDR